jgi:hypothetical protein
MCPPWLGIYGIMVARVDYGMVRITYYSHNQWMDKYLVGAQDLWQFCFVVLAGNPPIKVIPCTENDEPEGEHCRKTSCYGDPYARVVVAKA